VAALEAVIRETFEHFENDNNALDTSQHLKARRRKDYL